MAKPKKEINTEDTNVESVGVDNIIAIIKRRAHSLFERESNSGFVEAHVRKLAEEIANLFN